MSVKKLGNNLLGFRNGSLDWHAYHGSIVL